MWSRPTGGASRLVVALGVAAAMIGSWQPDAVGAEPGPSDPATGSDAASPGGEGAADGRDGADSDPERARELHDEAKALYVGGHYEEALRKLERALEFAPEERDLHYNKAFVAEKLGQLDVAIAHYRICAQLERRPWELRRLETVLERVEGAKRRSEREREAAEAAEAQRSEPAPVQQGGTDFGPWPYIGTAVAGGTLALGTVFAVHAAVITPDGDGAATSAGVPIDEHDDAADAANASAIAANVAFVTAAVAGTAALVLLLIERLDRPSPLAPTLARSGPDLDPRRGLIWRF